MHFVLLSIPQFYLSIDHRNQLSLLFFSGSSHGSVMGINGEVVLTFGYDLANHD